MFLTALLSLDGATAASLTELAASVGLGATTKEDVRGRAKYSSSDSTRFRDSPLPVLSTLSMELSCLCVLLKVLIFRAFVDDEGAGCSLPLVLGVAAPPLSNSTLLMSSAGFATGVVSTRPLEAGAGEVTGLDGTGAVVLSVPCILRSMLALSKVRGVSAGMATVEEGEAAAPFGAGLAMPRAAALSLAAAEAALSTS